MSLFIFLFALMSFWPHLSPLEGGYSVNSRQSQTKEHLDKSLNTFYCYFVVSYVWGIMRIVKKLTCLMVKWLLISGFCQEAATAPGLWQCWSGSQNSPALGQVLLFGPLSREIWRAGAIPTGSLQLWWVGSPSRAGCCVWKAGTEQRDRAEGKCSDRAVLTIPALPAPWSRLSEVAASLSLWQEQRDIV